MGKIRNEKLNKSVFGGHETVRVAAVQAPKLYSTKNLLKWLVKESKKREEMERN
ncbi:hypothetical protein N1I87_01070 [Bacillus sp. FSL W8-0102]|uniref:hypothetical protein n=1 Tax=Bacillus sp. FSL W8-0102 TaxID=2978205 RepID=UPI0030FBCA50